jgi:hypothetical protein
MTQLDPNLADSALHGITLARYAAVHAGLGEGFELDAVLAHEGLDPAAWREAEDAWSDALLEDVESDHGLHGAFDEHITAAQDRLGRDVPPLDGDLQAWLDVVRHFAAAPAPVALLERCGLRATDLIRLHRAWSRRLAIEPALGQEALEILGRAPGELPVLRPEPRKLAPAAPRVPPPAAKPLAKRARRRADPKEKAEETATKDGTPGVFVDLAQWLSGEEPAPPPAAEAPAAQAPPLAPLRASPPAAVPPPAVPQEPPLAAPAIEETAPPQTSPLAGVLPFAGARAPAAAAAGSASDGKAALAPRPREDLFASTKVGTSPPSQRHLPAPALPRPAATARSPSRSTPPCASSSPYPPRPPRPSSAATASPPFPRASAST